LRIFITGATGFIGSFLADELKKEHDIVGTGHVGERDISIPIIHWQDAGKIDVLIHLAANNDTQNKDYDAMMGANYYWPIELFKFYHNKGCDKFIWASSGAVVDCLTPYAESKKSFEGFTKTWSAENNVSCVGLRFTNVWSYHGEEHKGKRASMVYQILNKIQNDERPVLFTEKPTRDFIHISDVVNCIKQVIKYDVNGVFNLGSGTSVSFEDVVNHCNNVLGKNIEPEYVDCPFKDTYQFYTCADISETTKVFDWTPTKFIV
jgi:nucleoside-diphosphate-sugar epimerase